MKTITKIILGILLGIVLTGCSVTYRTSPGRVYTERGYYDYYYGYYPYSSRYYYDDGYWYYSPYRRIYVEIPRYHKPKPPKKPEHYSPGHHQVTPPAGGRRHDADRPKPSNKPSSHGTPRVSAPKAPSSSPSRSSGSTQGSRSGGRR